MKPNSNLHSGSIWLSGQETLDHFTSAAAIICSELSSQNTQWDRPMSLLVLFSNGFTEKVTRFRQMNTWIYRGLTEPKPAPYDESFVLSRLIVSGYKSLSISVVFETQSASVIYCSGNHQGWPPSLTNKECYNCPFKGLLIQSQSSQCAALSNYTW